MFLGELGFACRLCWCHGLNGLGMRWEGTEMVYKEEDTDMWCQSLYRQSYERMRDQLHFCEVALVLYLNRNIVDLFLDRCTCNTVEMGKQSLI